MSSPTAYGPPPPPWVAPARRTVADRAFGLVAGLLLMGAGLFNGLLLFIMCFVPDGCGTTEMSSKLVCDGRGYLVVLAAPWVSLLAAVVAAGVGAATARRRGVTPWPALLLGALVHGAGLATVWFGIWG